MSVPLGSIIVFTIMLPFLISYIMVFFTIVFSDKYQLYDSQGGRKIHSGNIPRLGGVGILTAYISASIILHFVFPKAGVLNIRTILFLSASAFIFIFGLLDDLLDLKPIFKLIFQCVAAFIVVAAGYAFKTIHIFTFNYCMELGVFSYVITFFWIIGMVNAINLLDGIDGQAGCISVAVLLSYCMCFYFAGASESSIYIGLILIAGIFGFLAFNLLPKKAKIFMGDGGSQFLGFIMAVFPLVQNRNNCETIELNYAFCFLIIPIFDTFAAIWRRKKAHVSITSADKFHIHHKLMLLGFSPRQSLVIVLFLQMVISLFVLVAYKSKTQTSSFNLTGVIIFVVLFFMILHFEKEKRTSNFKENG